MKICVRVGERKKAVEYWLFTCKQNTNVFNHGDFGGRGGDLSFRVLFFQNSGRGDPILLGTRKVPWIEVGVGVGALQNTEEGRSHL